MEYDKYILLLIFSLNYFINLEKQYRYAVFNINV